MRLELLNTIRNGITALKSDLGRAWSVLTDLGATETQQDAEHLAGAIESLTTYTPTASLGQVQPTSISYQGFTGTELDLTAVDWSKVTSFSFYSCANLERVEPIGNAKPAQMNTRFMNCTHLYALDLSAVDFSNCTDFGRTFLNCLSLWWIDLSNANMSAVSGFSQWAQGCAMRTLIGDHTLAEVESNQIATFCGVAFDFLLYGSLRYSSVLAICKGVSDLTGKTGRTITIPANIWNGMFDDDDTTPTADVVAQRQANILDLLNAKNWTKG